MICAYCSSDDLRFKGYKGVNKDKKEYKCNDCGKYFKVRQETKTVIELKEPDVVSWRDLTKIAREHQKLRENMSFGHTEAQCYIDKDRIVLLPLADLHVGNEGVDYLFIDSVTEYIIKNEVYVALIGDCLDSFFTQFKIASAIFEQVLNPEEQQYFLESWLNDIEPLLVAATWDNHSTQRAEAILGHDIFGRLQSRFAPFFKGIGKLNLQVGKIVYEIVMTHKGRGRSKFNPTHGLFNLDRDLVSADLFLGGHYHNPAFASFEIRGRNVYAIQAGTAEVKDLFAERHFRFGQGQCSFPCVVLDGKEKKIIPFERVEDAVKFCS